MVRQLPEDATLPEVVAAVNDIMRVLEPEPPYLDITSELPTHPTKTYNSRAVGDIRQIVVHHVGVDASVPPANTAAYCIRVRDFPGIPYSFYIMRDGTAYQTLALETVGWHCGASCNPRSVGLCLEGSWMAGRVPPDVQLAAASDVIRWLLWQLELPPDAVVGHKEVPTCSTACPGSTWPLWKDKIIP